MLDKIPLPLVQKLEPSPVDYGDTDEAWDLWECVPNIHQLPASKVEPLLGCNDDNPTLKVDMEGAADVPLQYTPFVNDLTGE